MDEACEARMPGAALGQWRRRWRVRHRYGWSRASAPVLGEWAPAINALAQRLAGRVFAVQSRKAELAKRTEPNVTKRT